MQRVITLLKKELYQNRLGFSFLVLAQFLALGLMMLNVKLSGRSLSMLEAESLFLINFIPIGAMFLGNRLVVKEYHSKTQLFVEALPISRIEMLLVKYFLGLVFLFCIVLISLALSIWWIKESDPVSFRFISILSIRSHVFCYFVWSLFFTMGFTGRFRLPIYILFAFGLMIIYLITDIDLYRTGPLSLVRMDDFPLERYSFPWAELWWTFFGGTLWLCLSFFLALLNEGSVAESLAKPMSQREKVTIGVLVFIFISAAALIDEKKVKEPYKFTSNAVLASEREPIEILYLYDALRNDAEILMGHVEKTVTDLRKTMDLSELPPIRIALRETLDPNKFETARLQENDGILVRANFEDMPLYCLQEFKSYIIRAILDNTTRFRSQFDPKQWLHDGYSCWMAQGGFDIDADSNRMLLLRSMHVIHDQKLTPDIVRDWSLFRERYGEPFATATAYSLLAYLQEQKGAGMVVSLAKGVFGRIPPNDIRETIYEIHHPMPVVFKDKTGGEWEIFLSGFNEWLSLKMRLPEFREKINEIPIVKGYVSIEQKEGNIRDIVYGFNFSQRPDGNVVCALLHKKLPPFDSVLPENEIIREEKMCTADDKNLELHLTGKYGKGERLFFALEYDSEILGVPVRILAKRMDLP